MNESDVITETKKDMEEMYKDIFFYKIPDGFTIRGGSVCSTGQKPFDVFGCWSNLSFGLEFKHQKGGKSFYINPKKVPRHQIMNLLHVQRNGWYARFIVRVGKTTYEFLPEDVRDARDAGNNTMPLDVARHWDVSALAGVQSA